MSTKIYIIEENSLVYSDSGYAILSAGTPVLLQSVIKDLESGEEVASIIDDKGNSYKMLEADLIPLETEDIKLLQDDSLPLSCSKHKKIARKVRNIPYYATAIFGIPLAFLQAFNISAPLLSSILFPAFLISVSISAFWYIRNERKGKYPVCEDYFLSYEENKEKLLSLLKKEKEQEEAEEEYADLGDYEEKREEENN